MRITGAILALVAEDDREWVQGRSSVEDAVTWACHERLSVFCRRFVPEAWLTYAWTERSARLVAHREERALRATYLAMKEPDWVAFSTAERPATRAYLAVLEEARAELCRAVVTYLEGR